MTLLIQSLPLLVLVAILASGRAGPLPACAAALLAALPAIALALPGGAGMAGFLARQSLQAFWLALPPMGIIAGGLLFHEAVRAPDRAEPTATGPAAHPADLLFTTGFLLGPFAESVTGFGVGTVFAIGTLRAAGLSGAPAAAIALLAQILVPWGGLGPGTTVGAALAGLPAQTLAWHTALLSAAWLVLLLPLFWRLAALAGRPVPLARRPAQAGWIVAMAALLLAGNRLLPWEIAGVLATGPLLAIRLLRAHPPRSREDWRSAFAAAAPYLLLTAVLLGGRAWGGAPALAPFPGLPPLPLTHPMVALWLVALLLIRRRAGPLHAIGAALRRWRRPGIAILLYVLLARWLAGAGIAAALAGALERGLGGAAPFAAPFLGMAGGFFSGSNVGSNSTMMAIQAALGGLFHLPPALLPAVQNFTGSACMMLSPQACAVAAGLAGGGATPGRIWRLSWPAFIIVIAIGAAAVALGLAAG